MNAVWGQVGIAPISRWFIHGGLFQGRIEAVGANGGAVGEEDQRQAWRPPFPVPSV
jgi:hypothetical protein